ncbi:MAG: hypothetical protein ACYCU8_12920 [Ferrimicrobium acidiphilum]
MRNSQPDNQDSTLRQAMFDHLNHLLVKAQAAFLSFRVINTFEFHGQRGLPLAYFVGIAHGIYLPIYPVYVEAEDRSRHEFAIAVDVKLLPKRDTLLLNTKETGRYGRRQGEREKGS